MNTRNLFVISIVLALSVIASPFSQQRTLAGETKDVKELTLVEIQPGSRFHWPGGGTSGAGRWMVKADKFETPCAAYYKEDTKPAIFMGKLPDDREETLQWSPQTTHVIIGKNILKGVAFDSDPTYPLVFRLISGQGYVYMCGRGTITPKSGPMLMLGAADTVEWWLPLLSSNDPMRAEGAAIALGYLAKSAETKDKAIPALIEALDSSEFGVRWSATEALGRLEDARALTPLLRIRETGGFLARLADESLGRIPGAPPYILEQQLLDAAEAGDLNSVTQLLESGANVNAMNKYGNSALNLALGNDHRDVAELLMKKGADIHSRSQKGDTSLHWAAYQGYSNIVKLLLTGGVDVNAKCKNGSIMPLHAALLRQHMDIARLLIDKGANVNAKEENGFTPLHMLVHFNGSTDVAELLLAKGADINAKTSDGQTPLDLALTKGNTAMAEILRKHGANK